MASKIFIRLINNRHCKIFYHKDALKQQIKINVIAKNRLRKISIKTE
jgi:hypothetical protein